MSKLTLKPSIKEEFSIINQALIKVNFHKGKAAKELGISRKTLYNKLNKYQKEVLNQN